MPIKTIEAQLVLAGKDAGASAAVMAVVKAYQQAEQAGKGMSKEALAVAKALQTVEKEQAAVNAVMGARNAAATAEANLGKIRTGATGVAAALAKARVEHQAFEGVKVAKGSEMAAQMTAAAKALATAERAQRAATREVSAGERAVQQQARALREAERAASAANVPLKALEQHQAHLARTVDQATEAMRRQIRVDEQAARAAQHHARERAEAAKHMRAHGVMGAAGALASGAVGVHGVTHVIGHGLKAGAEVQGARVDMAKAGIPFAERQHITDESLKLSAKMKNVTQSSVMELWKELRSVVTDPHEVDHIIEPLVKAKSLLDARDSTGTASHGLNLLVKGAESIGAAKDPARLTKLVDGYVKAMQVMGSTVTPEGIYEMQKYSHASGARWSDRFLMTTMQSLSQELGGSTAGNSTQVAQKQIVGGMQNLHSKAKEFARIGLIDPKNLDVLKSGEVKGVKAGVKHAVKGDDLAATDLDLWVYKYLLPHLEKSGIKNEGDQLAWVTKNFTGTGGDIISKLITQRESFEAHARMYGEASGTEGYKLNRSDPTAALGEVTKSLETFLGVLASPNMVQAAHALDDVATSISGWTLKLDAFNKEHPDLAKAAGPVAATAGLIGSGAASVAMWKAFNGGFGLKGSAAALDHSAVALEAAAVRLGAPGGAPGGDPKGGKRKGILGAGVDVLGALGLEPLAEAAQARGIFTMPDLGKDGIGRSALNFLDPNLGNLVLGREKDEYFDRETRRGQEMMRRDAAANAGREAGEKAGEGVKDGLKVKSPEIVNQAQSIFDTLTNIFKQGIVVPLQMSFDGSGMGGGSGVQSAGFGGGGLGGLIHRASVGGAGGFTGGSGGGAGGPGAANANFTTENADALKRTAAGLGISARDLATVVSYETRGTFSPSIVGGAGNRHQGLIQFGPSERGEYGANGGQTFVEQLGAVSRYLRARGVRPGMGIADIYSAINAGRPGQYGANDGNGTVAQHVERMVREHGARADMFLGGRGGGGDYGGLRAGLRVKGGLGGQAFAGGANHGALIEMAMLLQSGGGVARFTAFNDRYHAGTGSMHARGLAMDVTGNAAKILANARAVMDVAGLAEGKDFKVINEYLHPSRRATGGHVHFEFRSRDAADRFSKDFGQQIGGAHKGAEIPAEPSSLRIPDAPRYGIGGGSTDKVVDRLHGVVDRMEDMSWRSHHTVEVNAGPGLQAKTKRMRIQTDGPVRGNVGVSMPQTEIV